MELEQGKNADFWRDMTIITEDEIAKLRKLEASGKGPGNRAGAPLGPHGGVWRERRGPLAPREAPDSPLGRSPRARLSFPGLVSAAHSASEPSEGSMGSERHGAGDGAVPQSGAAGRGACRASCPGPSLSLGGSICVREGRTLDALP